VGAGIASDEARKDNLASKIYVETDDLIAGSAGSPRTPSQPLDHALPYSREAQSGIGAGPPPCLQRQFRLLLETAS